MLNCHKEMGRHWIGSVNVAVQQANIVHSPKVVHPEFVTRLTRRVPLVEQQLLTHPEHLSSPPVFSGVRVTRSLVLCVCFVDCNLLFVLLSFFFWSLCCLSSDLRILIIPLVSSNSSSST